jgi:glycolate oxidase FAD binding subunit
VITEITVKVLPAPEDSATVVVRGLSAEAAVAVLSAALGSPFGVSGAAYLPAASAELLGESGSLTLVRIEESASSVAYRCEKLRAALGADEIWPASRSVAAWRAVRDGDVLPAAADDAVWRVSVRPSRGAGVLAAVEAAGGAGVLDWGGGLVLVAGPATEAMHAAVTGAARAAGGVWTLLRAPAPWREVVAVVPAEAPALSAITRRVKAVMDPRGILNPGRIFAGI